VSTASRRKADDADALRSMIAPLPWIVMVDVTTGRPFGP
jgi:hypothetical protein